MKILFASSEAVPLVKTGGLADVSGALPQALRRQHQDVRLVLPAYRSVLDRVGDCSTVARLVVHGQPVDLLETRLDDSRVPVYLVHTPALYDRPGNPYVGADGQDWPDNADRFAHLARVVVEIATDRAGLRWRPELVHCNDWQTALAPALLSREVKRPATLFTIHNLAYQGLFDWPTLQRLGLPEEWWSWQALEFHGHLSFIKGGLAFADWISTVSPTYACEIRTPRFGYGLEGLLEHRADRLGGILNGVDYSVWDPRHDPLLPATYNGRSLAGKRRCREALQQRFDLDTNAAAPLFAHIGRLVEQKGVDLILDCLPKLLAEGAQLVVLGSGDARLEAALRAAATKTPGRVGVHIGYDEALAHLIEAGADSFLMPSRFEPCGLNQLYSLRYGTVPVVHRTGGLADSVVDTTEQTLAAGSATGFQFDMPTAEALAGALERALDAWRQPKLWRQLVASGMRQDFSWTRSARSYLELYHRILSSPRHPAPA